VKVVLRLENSDCKTFEDSESIVSCLPHLLILIRSQILNLLGRRVFLSS
jgi:hypothetical protein